MRSMEGWHSHSHKDWYAGKGAESEVQATVSGMSIGGKSSSGSPIRRVTLYQDGKEVELKVMGGKVPAVAHVLGP